MSVPRRGFASIAGLVVIIWLVSHAAWIKPLDDALFDYISSSLPRSDAPPAVVLVRAELRAHHFDDEYWLGLLTRLRSGEPRRIAFMMMPEGASAAFFESAANGGDVVFGRTLVLRENDLGYEGVSIEPEAAAPFNLPFGIVEPAPAVHGVHRRTPLRVEFQGQQFPAFAPMAAFGPQSVTKNGASSFLLDFSRGPNGLPQASADRILADDFNAQAFKDKVVIVGYVDDTYIPMVSTPFNGGVAQMSVLGLQGIAVDNLLSQRTVTALTDTALLPILLLLAVVLFPIFIRLRFVHGIALSAALLAVVYFAAQLSLTKLQLWLPSGPIALLIVIEFFYTAFIAMARKDQAIQAMTTGALNRLSRLDAPVSVFDSPDYWRHIADFIDARLDVRRLIILDLEGGRKPRLKEVIALNCAFADIDERRRDPSRVPYSFAAESKKPSRLTAPFFKEPQSNEEEFLLPLRFGEEILGFWAFSIEREKMVQIPLFSPLVAEYAEEIGKLLYERRIWRGVQKLSWFDRWFSFDPKRVSYNRARHAVAALGGRLKMMEDVFDLMTTAIGVFDLFGRFVAGSEKLRVLLKNAGLGVDEFDLVAILTRIANVPAAEVKRSLRYVVHQRGSISVVTSVTEQSGATLTLHVRPLQRDPDEDLGEADAAPFDLRGVIVELVDVTQLRQIYELKEGLVEKINKELRQSLQGVQHAASMMGNNTVPQVHRGRLLTLTSKKLVDAVNVLEEAQRYLDLNVHGARLECFPVELKPLIERALEAVRLTASQRGIGFRIDLENLGQEFVFADPETCRDVIMLVLNYLASRARPDTTVDLYVKQDPLNVIKRHEVVLWFMNQSEKETQASLQAKLLDDTTNSRDEYFQLRNAMRIIQTWGGALSIDVEGGKHIVVKLTLKGFF